MLSKKAIYTEAIHQLERRRQQAEDTANEHFLEACNRAPKIRELRRRLGKTSIQLSKAILSGTGDPAQLLDQIKQENLQTQKQIRQLLKESHLPEDYLEIKYHCDKCNDRGYINRKQCSCLKDLIIQIAVQDLQESTQLQLSSFDTFLLSYYQKPFDDTIGCSPYQQMSRVYAFCKKYAEQFYPHCLGIFMTGKTGLGKTHLSLAIARRIIDRGYTAIYTTVSEIIRRISGQYFHKGNTDNQEDLMELISHIDLLILDDLGAEFESSFNTAIVYDMINSRLSANRPTIISTNLTPQELQKRYSERIVSRLFTQLTPLHFVGQDVRTLLSAGERHPHSDI